ncbi:TetR/AcrR family transcriptional regulator [Thalassotalea fonticola]|uniref:TetR/AcrR family transcriptional regulator n=1 Tax=Thalassotalea fonticola TaxID=3065649 RepID=A0ABZ0GTJ2_9GAMM|nr:TetR/AcrR family transcriptional regulator [Colwelliaceae bacterium S1-1]
MARSNEKNQAIIAAAISEFKNKGFETTSMDQIAHSAGVSKRTVYNHFASKNLLFDAIIKQMLALFTTAVSIHYQADKSLALQLTDIAEQELRLLSDPAFIDLAKVIMAEAMHSPHRINQALAEVEKRDGNLSGWISAANADGVLKVDDAEFATTQFFALLKGFCFWPQVVQGQPFPDKSQQQDIISSAVTMFLGNYQS